MSSSTSPSNSVQGRECSGPRALCAPLKCDLLCWSDSPHLYQLYTGLADLHRDGLIRLNQRLLPCAPPNAHLPHHLQSAHVGHALLLAGGQRLYFDMHDSQELDAEAVAGVDWYFKRSLPMSRVLSPGGRARLRPWGLNYRVESNHLDRFAVMRQFRWGSGLNRFREILRHVFRGRLVSMAQREFESAPPEGEPSVLFLTRLWDPENDPQRSTEKKRHFESLNAARAECVRQLKMALGASFHGGLMDTELARRLHPELIVPPDMTRKDRYLEQARRHAICVASTGLHGSIGWKLAEYVALSRAIVSERLENDPGDGFEEGRHYLAYDSTDQCVAQVRRMMEDAPLRKAICINNQEFYLQRLVPARLVANVLAQALGPLRSFQ